MPHNFNQLKLYITKQKQKAVIEVSRMHFNGTIYLNESVADDIGDVGCEITSLLMKFTEQVFDIHSENPGRFKSTLLDKQRFESAVMFYECFDNQEQMSSFANTLLTLVMLEKEDSRDSIRLSNTLIELLEIVLLSCNNSEGRRYLSKDLFGTYSRLFAMLNPSFLSEKDREDTISRFCISDELDEMIIFHCEPNIGIDRSELRMPNIDTITLSAISAGISILRDPSRTSPMIKIRRNEFFGANSRDDFMNVFSDMQRKTRFDSEYPITKILDEAHGHCVQAELAIDNDKDGEKRLKEVAKSIDSKNPYKIAEVTSANSESVTLIDDIIFSMMDTFAVETAYFRSCYGIDLCDIITLKVESVIEDDDANDIMMRAISRLFSTSRGSLSKREKLALADMVVIMMIEQAIFKETLDYKKRLLKDMDSKISGNDKMKDFESENAHLQKKLDNAITECDSLRDKNMQLKNSLELEKNKASKKSKEELRQVKKELSDQKKETKSAKQELKEAKESILRLQEEIEGLKNTKANSDDENLAPSDNAEERLDKVRSLAKENRILIWGAKDFQVRRLSDSVPDLYFQESDVDVSNSTIANYDAVIIYQGFTCHAQYYAICNAVEKAGILSWNIGKEFSNIKFFYEAIINCFEN